MACVMTAIYAPAEQMYPGWGARGDSSPVRSQAPEADKDVEDVCVVWMNVTHPTPTVCRKLSTASYVHASECSHTHFVE
eukprot:1394308-Pleurochrysis_carterae.AAC.1